MIKRGEFWAERVRRPQGYTLRVYLDGPVPAAGITNTSAGTSDEVPPATSYQAPTNDLQRVEALAAYRATRLAPALAGLRSAREQLAAQAETIGQLRAQLTAAEATRVDSPGPRWRRWAGWWR
jgi:hypothetical protein